MKKTHTKNYICFDSQSKDGLFFALTTFTKNYIQKIVDDLRKTNSNTKNELRKQLGIQKTQMYRLLSRLDIDTTDFKRTRKTQNKSKNEETDAKIEESAAETAIKLAIKGKI